jgi:hypothetical protein
MREEMKVIDMAPALAERVRGGSREERFVGTADVRGRGEPLLQTTQSRSKHRPMRP